MADVRRRHVAGTETLASGLRELDAHRSVLAQLEGRLVAIQAPVVG